MVHQHRHPVIWVHLEELRGELIAPSDVTRHNLIGNPQLLHQDCHLLAVRCRPLVHGVHGYAPPCFGSSHHATGSAAGNSPGADTGLQRNACPAGKTVIPSPDYSTCNSESVSHGSKEGPRGSQVRGKVPEG